MEYSTPPRARTLPTNPLPSVISRLQDADENVDDLLKILRRHEKVVGKLEKKVSGLQSEVEILAKELERENADLVSLKGRAFVIRRFEGKGAPAAVTDDAAITATTKTEGSGSNSKYCVDVDRGVNRDECSLTFRPVGIASIGYARDAETSFLPSLPSSSRVDGVSPAKAGAAASPKATTTASSKPKRSGRTIRSSERKRRSQPYQQRIKSPLPSKTLKTKTLSATESMLALSKY